MPEAPIFAAVMFAASLGAWGARRDLQLPVWTTLALFAAAASATTLSVGLTFAPLAALVLICVMIIEADRRHQLIPDAFTAAVAVLSLVMPFAEDGATHVLGALVLAATFLAVRQACTMWRGAEALGWGDVKFAAAMGAVLGPIYGFTAVAIAGLATLAMLVVRARGGVAVVGAPFGIGLAAATVAVSLTRAFAP